MRGRVGRGNRKAFCYLLAPPLADLPADSRRRLEALENFSDLGSGINIAMQDLDIRGAGNLLGSEQSGFISDLGYETYQKILNQAMAELRNEMPQDDKDSGIQGVKDNNSADSGNVLNAMSFVCPQRLRAHAALSRTRQSGEPSRPGCLVGSLSLAPQRPLR